MPHRRQTTLALAVAGLLVAPAVGGEPEPIYTILYVDDDAPPAGDGQSWETAYRYLQDAIAAANALGEPVEIRVAQGVYRPDLGEGFTPGDKASGFILDKNMTLKGGYAGPFMPDANQRDPAVFVTTITGDLNSDDQPDFVNYGDNTTGPLLDGGAVIGPNGATLDGFTIRGGANATLAANVRGFGLIRHCVFRENMWVWTGAGGFSGGGALYLRGAQTVEDCSFFDNYSGAMGGALFFRADGGTAVVRRCTFMRNRAAVGGAIAMYRSISGGRLEVLDSIIAYNSTHDEREWSGGGGAFLGSSLVVNCTIYGNRAPNGHSGGVLAGEQIGFFGAPDIYNTILWGNTDTGSGLSAQVSDLGTVLNEVFLGHCLIQGDTERLDGWVEFHDECISVDPGFIDTIGPDGVVGTGDEDFRVGAGSPAIDAGDTDDVESFIGDTDIAGLPRVHNDGVAEGYGLIDIGAHEYQMNCDGIWIPDSEQIAFAPWLDCDANGVIDSCEVEFDCNGNGVRDACELADGLLSDCNANGIPDACELAMGLTTDDDVNGVPDECQRLYLYVNGTAVVGGDGLSWDGAFSDLQDALGLAEARPGHTEVWVATGVYTPDRGTGDRDASFRLGGGMSIYGGFAGDETHRHERNPRTNPTVLSGDLVSNDLPDFLNREDNAQTVVVAGPTDGACVLDGFTVRGGHATSGVFAVELFYSDGELNDWGAGVRIGGNQVRLVDCIITDNDSAWQGAGVYVTFDARGSVIERCVIRGNRAGYWGSAISAEPGALRMSNALIAGNTVMDVAEVAGGTVFLRSRSVGGINGLGSVYGMELSGCTFTANQVSVWGSSIGEIAKKDSVVNSVFWGNQPEYFVDQFGYPPGLQGFAFSIIGGLAPEYVDEGVAFSIDDPAFVDPIGPDGVPGTGDEDYALSPGSPAIDSGSNERLPTDLFDFDSDGDTQEALPFDLTGAARRVDDPASEDAGEGSAPVVDRGAFEFVPPDVDCAEDLTGDDAVNSADLNALLAAFGDGVQGDIDGDGDTDSADLNLLLAAFGEACP